MSNNVFLNDQDIVECHVVGDQTSDSVSSMGKKIKLLVSELKKAGKPCLVLDDLTAMGAVPPAPRRKVVELAKTLPYDRLAMLGKGGVLRMGANIIIRVSGRHRRMRYFSDRDEALAWLQEPRR